MDCEVVPSLLGFSAGMGEVNCILAHLLHRLLHLFSFRAQQRELTGEALGLKLSTIV